MYELSRKNSKEEYMRDQYFATNRFKKFLQYFINSKVIYAHLNEKDLLTATIEVNKVFIGIEDFMNKMNSELERF